jgi:hypothetical protein
MFRLQVTIIRQTFQYMDMTYSVLTVWDPMYNTITQWGGSYHKKIILFYIFLLISIHVPILAKIGEIMTSTLYEGVLPFLHTSL